jgi:SH3 domain-containing YSC84-like protein 1
MKTSHRSLVCFFSMVLVLTLLMTGCSSTREEKRTETGSAPSNDYVTANQLVQKCDMTLQDFMRTPELQAFRDLLRRADGAFISPQVLEGAFVFGASGGSGVFMARTSQTPQWSPPAFYTMGEVSFGLQIGGKAAQVILLAMTNRGKQAFMSTNFKLGADVSVAAGPIGAGVSAETANLSADILTFSLAKGLYGGISLQGAVMAVRNDWDAAYYNQPGIAASDILTRGVAQIPPAARTLVADLSKATVTASAK